MADVSDEYRRGFRDGFSHSIKLSDPSGPPVNTNIILNPELNRWAADLLILQLPQGAK